MNLSPHFTLAELCTTSRLDTLDADKDGNRAERFPNVPGPVHVKRLRLLCVNVLEPIRLALGVPIRVSSGFRSKALNVAIKGAKGSQHCDGDAADCEPLGMDIEAAFRKVAAMIREGTLPADQAIIYLTGGFFHVSYAGDAGRREVLRSAAASGSGGPYSPYLGPANNAA